MTPQPRNRVRLSMLLFFVTVLVLTTLNLGNAVAAQSPTAGSTTTSETDVTVQHLITCTVTPSIPIRSGGDIYAYGKRTCTDSPDVANLTIYLQRYSNGSWVNYGAPYTTNSTNTYIYAFDVNGCYNRGQTVTYRTRIVNEAFHGNWFTNSKNSASFTTSCPA